MQGVKIYLASRARIPQWIKSRKGCVTIKIERHKGVRIHILTIRGGQAIFIEGGGVAVKMPKAKKFILAFKARTVMWISDDKDKILETNHFLCRRCLALQETRVIKTESSNAAGLSKTTFQCALCECQWELEI